MSAKPKKQELKGWLVPYERTCRGEAYVEAATAEEAVAEVEGGGFEADRGEEQVDWKATGTAREDK